MSQTTKITVAATIDAPIAKVWTDYTSPEAVKQWNNASDDWHTPNASNDLQVGGEFVYTMAAKDGSFSFDFKGKYDTVEEHRLIEYTMEDGRQASITFTADGLSTHVEIVFDAESQNPTEMQQQGWQAILNNFKAYAETSI